MVKKKSDEIIAANKELIFQNEEKGKRAAELIIANKELAFQNAEKEKRAAELIIANKELAFQNREKEKRADELIIANKELVFKNKEKEKRAAELTRSKQLLDNTEKLARVGGWEFSLKNNELSWSEVIYRIYEVEPDYQPTIESAINFYAPESIPVISEAVRQAIEEGKSFDVDLQLITAKQNSIWVRTIGQAYRDNGEIVKIGGAFQDINDRILTEHKLILANKELTFQSKEKENRAAELIIANKELTFQNREKEKRASELIIANKELVFQKDEKEKRAAELILANKELSFQNEEKENRAAELIIDITERKLAEEKRKATYDTFISILNAYPGILKIIDPETYEIILVNKTFADKLPQYAKRKKCYEVFYELTSPCSFCTNEIIKNNNRQPYSWENYNPVTKTDYLYTDQLIKWPDGRDVRFEVAIDISERKKVEELLKITLQNLERSNKELEQFAYVASHDLQEPLRMVSSFTQLLERRYKDKLDQDANDFIQYAVDGANRMQKLINDLLDYSRITSRGKDFTKVDISQVLGQTISNLQQLIIENTALITNEDLPELKADESQILRVFQNLIENALKFQKKTELPKIHISCIKKNDFYEFSVRDNGIGMDMQYHDRVFTIFQRLHSKEEYPGTGIGLSICKRIVERHGGKIWFESNENEGTTFYFTLKI